MGSVFFYIGVRLGVATRLCRGLQITIAGFPPRERVGSIVDLTGTGSGKKQTLATYDWGPYGQGGLTKKSAKDLGNPLGYTGAYTDPTTGLVDLRARQYDPATGRFLTPDPLGPLGVGSYAYVGDNPLAYVDPSGLHRGPSCGWNLLCHLGHAAVACGSSPLCNTFLWIGSIASDNEEAAVEADVGAAASEGASTITMDEAIARAAEHVGSNGVMETTGNGLNYQFRSIATDTRGNVSVRIGRLDVNPADSHVSRLGAHLNLEVQLNGKIVSNSHIGIDPMTVRPGDIP